MKVIYDPRADVLTVALREDAPVDESDEISPGVILDYDIEGNVVGFEILDASRRVTEPAKIDLTVAKP